MVRWFASCLVGYVRRWNVVVVGVACAMLLLGDYMMADVLHVPLTFKGCVKCISSHAMLHHRSDRRTGKHDVSLALSVCCVSEGPERHAIACMLRVHELDTHIFHVAWVCGFFLCVRICVRIKYSHRRISLGLSVKAGQCDALRYVHIYGKHANGCELRRTHIHRLYLYVHVRLEWTGCNGEMLLRWEKSERLAFGDGVNFDKLLYVIYFTMRKSELCSLCWNVDMNNVKLS